MVAMRKPFKLKLLGRNVEITVASQDAPGSDMVDGVARLREGKIILSAESNRIHTIFHELCHIFHERSGVDWNGAYSPEHIADTFGALVRALIEENGVHIVERIVKFIEGAK